MVDFSSFGASILDFDCYKMIKDLLPYFLSVAEYHDFPDFFLNLLKVTLFWKICPDIILEFWAYGKGVL